MNRDERLATAAQAAGLLSVLSTLAGYLLLGSSETGAMCAKLAIPAAAVLLPVTLALGIIARWRLRQRELSDRYRRYAINGTTLATITLILLLLLMVALPSNRNAVRHLRSGPASSALPAG
jgi:ACR3 family arsenite efflux pump ArsB